MLCIVRVADQCSTDYKTYTKHLQPIHLAVDTSAGINMQQRGRCGAGGCAAGIREAAPPQKHDAHAWAVQRRLPLHNVHVLFVAASPVHHHHGDRGGGGTAGVLQEEQLRCAVQPCICVKLLNGHNYTSM